MRKISRIFGALLVPSTWFATALVAHADVYGSGSFGSCQYSEGCGAASGILPGTGGALIIFSSLGILIIAAALGTYFFMRRRRNKQQTAIQPKSNVQVPPNGPPPPVAPPAPPQPQTPTPPNNSTPPRMNG